MKNPPIRAECREVWQALPLPGAVRAAWEANCAILPGAGEIALGEHGGSQWWATGGDAGGWWLVEHPAEAPALPWAAVDAEGWLWAASWWDHAGGGRSIAGLWLLRPDGGWSVLHPGAAESPVWGGSHLLRHHVGLPGTAEAAPPQRMPAWGLAPLHAIPPMDTPSQAPPGLGSALLNWLAWLARHQGVGAIPYRGPYPTASLYASLCGAFRPEGAGARARFLAREGELPLLGEMAENPVAWRPAPWAPRRPHPRILAAVMGLGAGAGPEGLARAWVDGAPFTLRDPARHDGGNEASPMPTGLCLWPTAGEGGGPGEYALGWHLLGQPARTMARLGADGALLEAPMLPPQGYGTDPVEAPHPMHPRLALVIRAWAAMRAPAALADCLWPPDALQGGWAGARWHWRLDSLMLGGCEGGAGLPAPWLHPALASQYHLHTRQGAPPAETAMRLLSDAMVLLEGPLRLIAQAMLAESAPEGAAVWHARAARGAEAQALAGETLRSTLPELLRDLVGGVILP